MNTKYVIVDKDGDEVNLYSFKANTDIPVRIQAVSFDSMGNITIVLRYEHENMVSINER